MPELCHPDGPVILGHELRAGGKPLVQQRDERGFIEDAIADGPEGCARCECGRSSGLCTSDQRRREWHARHLQDVRCAQDRRARRLLAVHEELGHRQCGHEHCGKGGRSVKGGSQVAHGSSRCRKRTRECSLQSPLCAAGRRLHPLLTC